MMIDELYFSPDETEESQRLAHEGRSKMDGAPIGSGRYPLGSGENPFQRDEGFASRLSQLKKEHPDWSNTEIAHAMNMSTQEFRARVTINKEATKMDNVQKVVEMKAHGYSDAYIANRLGISESSVRNYLKPQDNSLGKKTASSTALKLKELVDAKGMIDIGAGAEIELGVSDTMLTAASQLLKANGYSVISGLEVQQATNPGKYTSLKVIAPPGTTKSYAFHHSEDIKSIADYDAFSKQAEELHPGFERTKYGMYYPQSIDSDRILIRYPKDGGAEKDGVIELRRGVEDISLGKSNYAQVRIAVDDKMYLKGMAIYSDNIPDGYDIVFNTSKADNLPKEEVFKKFKEKDDGTVDRDNVFGAAIKPEEKGGQRFYKDENGKEHLSAINIVNAEGDWMNWKKRLSSQFLSKQNKPLIEQQLNITYDNKVNEYESIMAITNPTIRRKYLESFADDCDASAVHLKAAALPGQTSGLLLPLPDIPDGQIYAPNYNTGDTVVLIRHPHGGTFEIPVLKVNNNYKPGKELIGRAPDAVGINLKAAAQLSGADFDGDTALVIPVSRGGVGTKIKTSQPLQDLQGFTTDQYAITDKNSPLYKVDSAHGFRKQDQMGKISNLITDMTLIGAPDAELARAVKHSMVIIDAEKHHLDWRQSAKDNGVAELYKKYQGKAGGGAATLISKAKSPYNIPKRKIAYTNPEDPDDPNVVNGINVLTGEKVYKPSGESYHKPIYEYERDENGVVKKDKKTGRKVKTGRILGYEEEETVKTQKISKMQNALETGSAEDLISVYNTQQEQLYANYANKVYALANKARKEAISTTPIPYNKEVAEKYRPEVEKLNKDLLIAKQNAPRERQAQLSANWVYKTKKQDNPNMTGEEEKKIKSQALAEARVRYGAKKARINIDDREWEAIQAGAISDTKLKEILENTDMDKLRDRAMPNNYKTALTPTRERTILNMYSNGYDQKEIAEQLGISVSTVNKFLLESR